MSDAWRQVLIEEERAALIRAMGSFLRAPLNEATAKKHQLDQAFADYDAAVVRSGRSG